jgi:hypothetical protein
MRSIKLTKPLPYSNFPVFPLYQPISAHFSWNIALSLATGLYRTLNRFAHDAPSDPSVAKSLIF